MKNNSKNFCDVIKDLNKLKVSNKKFEEMEHLKIVLLWLIKSAKIKMVFQQLNSIDTNKSNEIIHLHFRYSDIEDKRLNNLITNDEYNVEKNKIIMLLISLVNKL